MALALALGAACAGQSEAPPGATFHVTVPLVLVDALVMDSRNGRPIGGLTASDFAISENGEPETVSYVSRDELPLSVVLLLDLTDTVRPILKPLSSDAAGILSHLKDRDEVAVMVFSSTARLVQGFTTSRTLAGEAIGKASGMKSREATFLNESVYRAAIEAAQSTLVQSRKAIVCLTDGTVSVPSEHMRKTYGTSVPKGAIHTEDEAMRALFQTGASFSALIERSGLTYLNYAAEFTDPSQPVLRKRYPPGDVRKYAARTGGIVLTGGKSETSRKIGLLLDDLRGRYTLGYRPSHEARPGELRSIRVTLTPDAQKRLGKPLVRAREGYIAAPDA